jgi:hypothetical protein
VEADAGQHRVSWSRGRVALHDHDLAAERVLVALRGEPCPCLLILDALREVGGDWVYEGPIRQTARHVTRHVAA